MTFTQSDPAPTRAPTEKVADISIDGAQPASVIAPDSPRDVAEALADAAASGLAVAPVGGATAVGLGNIPERIDFVLSTERLQGIIAYEPTDLTLSVAAGARFADVQAALAEHGQTLPIDAPRPERATIGGLIATAIAGPRRYGAGTLRDLLIGISAAHPSGIVSKAGGTVVKNVSGFDLMRVYHGSLGTLGVIVSANFKVLPLPRFESSVLGLYPDEVSALATARRLHAGRVRPVALEAIKAPEGWVLAARIQGREGTVRLLAAETRELLATDTHVLEGPKSNAWWREVVEAQAPESLDGDALVRCSVRPSAVSALARGVLEAAAVANVATPYLSVSPGLGTVTLRVRPDRAGPHAEPLHALRDALLAIADQVTVLAAPVGLKRGIDVWGQPPPTLDVMRALKQEFDPGRVLNPGRFAGFI